MINSITSNDTITIFWNKHSSFEKGCFYRISLDGIEIGTNEKTHFTTNNLLENTEYSFVVELTGADGNCIQTETVSCRTQCVKKKIDITTPPYNAKGDGKTLNTKAIQAAIDDCKEGECVYIPSGDFMTGALRLHSDMELYVEKGGVLHGTENVEDYLPKIHSRFEGIEMMCYSSLLNMGELNHSDGYNCRNVIIRGEGTICSGGRVLAQNVIDIEKVLLKDYMDSLGDKILECENITTIPGRVRPRLINISNSQNVVISGLTLENGASWNVHMIYSDNVVTHNCTFRSENVWNGDGWDPDSSTNCTIFNCSFYTGDDSVAIKSGKNPEGNIINRPCEHIRIFDCISYQGHGITIGSEMSGGINDVRIWDCDLARSIYGVEIKATKKRGGYVRGIFVKDCELSRIMMHSVGYNDDGEPAPDIPIFEDCVFENLCLRGIEYSNGTSEPKDAIEFIGFEENGHFIKNVRLKNIMLDDNGRSRKQSISLQCCEGLSIENIYCR